jgi:lipopolysaccharide transport system ATP-binding protein
MNCPTIRVRGLGKRFLIGARVRRPDTLGASLALAVTRRLGYLRDHVTGEGRRGGRAVEEFWALRDVSFEVRPGQVLGIIGRNGSGKSTLLKILSRITPPAEGEATIMGRVGSLLEIGTGFHGELTGRENTFLSGTILGMRQREIAERFDEIVAFSGVERFIDTPVKHYSSGMYLRLAFAVAAHLRTEVLLVDEVLAVGDAAFQKQCIDKMSSVAREGWTVLFVSHNLGALSRLCDSGLLLEAGRVAAHGSIDEAISAYGRLRTTRDEEDDSDNRGGVVVRSLRVLNEVPALGASSPLRFGFTLSIRREYWAVHVYLGLTTPEGLYLTIEVAEAERFPEFLEPGRSRVEVQFPPMWLRPRGYTAWVKVIAHPASGPTERYYADRVEIVIAGEDHVDGNTDRLLAPETRWTVRPISDDSGGNSTEGEERAS